MNKKRSTLSALFILLVLLVPLINPVSVLATGTWEYSQPVVIDSSKVSASLTNYPVVIDSTISELATVGNGGYVRNTASGGISGSLTVPADFDIGTDSTCSTDLSFEFESYDETTGEVVVWVKIPSLDSSFDTTIYLCYGDSSITTGREDIAGTWSNNFAGVWHLSETSGSFFDSTSNNNHGSDYVSDTNKTGMIGNGQGFDGVDDYIQVDSSAGGSLDNLDDLHISLWLYLDTASDEMAIDRYLGSADDLQLWANGGDTLTWRTATYTPTDITVSTGEWYYINANFDGSTWRLYKDNQSPAASALSETASSNNNPWYFGTDTDGCGTCNKGNWYDGSMDEIRFSTVNRSADWITTNYNNMSSPETFYTVGAAVNMEDPETTSLSPADDETEVMTTTDLTLTFDQVVNVESGSIVIKKTSDDSTVQTIDVTSGDVTGDGSSVITVDINDLDMETEYYVQVDSTAFDDVDGNSYAGISDTTSWSFTTAGIVFGTHSVTTSAAIESAIESALGSYRPDAGTEYLANMWVVTNFTDTDNVDYDYVSLVGLIVDDPGQPDDWSLADSTWVGLAILRDDGGGSYTAAVEGSVAYDNMIDAADVDDPAYQVSGGTGSGRYFLPWVAGTLAKFGTKGVHYDVGSPGTGYGGRGWAAVDFVGGAVGFNDNVFPNGAYVAQSGTAQLICRDDVQAWVQIGNFLYGHLVYNTNLETGTYHSQGDYLGALVTGSHSLSDPGVSCGYMDQRSTSYHLHIGFKPSGDYFQWEDYVLNIPAEKFVKGSQEIIPGDYLLAAWSDNPDPAPTPGPTPTPGGPTPTPIPYSVEGGGGPSFWDGIINMIGEVVRSRVDDMPDHSHRDISNLAVSGVRIAVSTVYVMLRSNLDLTITMIVFGALIILEPVRVLRSIWMGVKEMVPFIG